MGVWVCGCDFPAGRAHRWLREVDPGHRVSLSPHGLQTAIHPKGLNCTSQPPCPVQTPGEPAASRRRESPSTRRLGHKVPGTGTRAVGATLDRPLQQKRPSRQRARGHGRLLGRLQGSVGGAVSILVAEPRSTGAVWRLHEVAADTHLAVATVHPEGHAGRHEQEQRLLLRELLLQPLNGLAALVGLL